MAAAEKRFLFPDDKILQQLFPNFSAVSATILAQTFDTCTFIARAPGEAEYVVRLEVLQGNVFRLRSVSALQKIAALAIPDLVPKVERTGVAQTESGVTVEFSLTSFVPDSVTLESIWDDLADNERSKIMDEVVSALQRIYEISGVDERVQSILHGSKFILDDVCPSDTPSSRFPIALGGPDIGYAKDRTDFLSLLVNAHNPAGQSPVSALRRNPEDNSITIISVYDVFGQVDLPVEELAQQRIVFCHGDLEPRNILVQPSTSPDSLGSYKVAAIIDWEMAGFFPWGYEFLAKDSFLGGSNQSFAWYSLFKQSSLFGADTFDKCRRSMQAVDIVLCSENQRLLLGRNVGAVIREKWLARERLERLPGNLLGWTRKAGATVPRYTKEDNEGLEIEVLKELGRI